VKTADVVQTSVGCYLKPGATADRYRTIPLEPRGRAAVVLYGRSTTPEMVGQVGGDGVLNNELSCVGRCERQQNFQERGGGDPPGRVEFDVFDDLTSVSRELVSCGVEFQPRGGGDLLVGSPHTHIEGRGGDEGYQHPVGDVEHLLDCFEKGFLS